MVQGIPLKDSPPASLSFVEFPLGIGAALHLPATSIQVAWRCPGHRELMRRCDSRVVLRMDGQQLNSTNFQVLFRDS